MKPPRTFGEGLEQPQRLRYVFEQVGKVLSNISFGTTLSNADADMNMQAHKASGTAPGVANTEFAVQHTLTHVPIGFLVVSTDRAAHIYKSTTAWTAATKTALGSIFLKSDTASVAFALVIL